eukprot:308952-Pelagomonas_calceolata.AAC.7
MELWAANMIFIKYNGQHGSRRKIGKEHIQRYRGAVHLRHLLDGVFSKACQSCVTNIAMFAACKSKRPRASSEYARSTQELPLLPYSHEHHVPHNADVAVNVLPPSLRAQVFIYFRDAGRCVVF